jgi:hypothetical protein
MIAISANVMLYLNDCIYNYGYILTNDTVCVTSCVCMCVREAVCESA